MPPNPPTLLDQFTGCLIGHALGDALGAIAFHKNRELLLEQARLSALPTHRHPVGIQAAQIVALAIAHVLNHRQFDHELFFADLRSAATTDELAYALKIAAHLTPH